MKKTKLLGLACIALTLNACTNNSQSDEDYAGFVSKDTANRMIQSYLTSIEVDTTISHKDSNLNSLIMDANELRAYLRNPEIKKVKIMLAHTMSYIEKGNEGKPAGYKSGALTVVISGFNNEGNYVLAPGSTVPDHATPCPYNCPQGTAASPLIQ